MNLKTSDWHALNKCDRMVEQYISDMNKCLSCSEWPDSYPEPKYLNTIEKYIRHTRIKVKLHISIYAKVNGITDPKILYHSNNAKEDYLIAIIQKLVTYKDSLGLK